MFRCDHLYTHTHVHTHTHMRKGTVKVFQIGKEVTDQLRISTRDLNETERNSDLDQSALRYRFRISIDKTIGKQNLTHKSASDHNWRHSIN